jgi:transcriptional regulator with XRE-family HTH domain
MNDLWKPVEPWLRQIMEERGWKISDWVGRAGMPHSTLSRPMNNKNYKSGPSLQTLTRLADAAGVPIPYELLARARPGVKQVGRRAWRNT